MPETILDCLGLSCPQPVLKCKECVDAGAPAALEVRVDNAPAAENVARFLGSQGYDCTTVESDGVFTISATLGDSSQCQECKIMTDSQIAEAAAKGTGRSSGVGTLVFIATPTLGSGDDELGAKLMQNFLLTLPELGDSLWRIILVNGAVHFATEGNPCLEVLQQLSGKGVSILVCGTCLDFFNVLEKKRVGETTNMLDVVTSLDLADKVIRV